MKSFKQFVNDQAFQELPIIDEVFYFTDRRTGTIDLLQEGKWISGRFPNNIRIDQPTHGVGQQHAHVYGRKGNELVVVNFDGSASHGSRGRLSDQDADALRAKSFKIPQSNIVEWIVLHPWPTLLLG